MASNLEAPVVERPGEPAASRYRAEDRPAGTLVIGFLNNMPGPAMAAAERQFCRLLTAASGRVPVCLRPFSLNGPDGKYAAIDDVWHTRLDGLVVTGTEPQAAELRDEPYWNEFATLFDWAEAERIPTILSCLAAHAAVLHHDGIPRRRLPEKRFGLFQHQWVSLDPLLEDVAFPVQIPHSRWNEVDEKDLAACGYRILTRSREAGADIFVRQGRTLSVHFQGHPEYEPNTLPLEYRRDVKRYLDGLSDIYPKLPRNYFDSEMAFALLEFRDEAMKARRPEQMARFPWLPGATPTAMTWGAAASTVYRNWLAYVGEHRA